jgi:hypothetical protein
MPKIKSPPEEGYDPRQAKVDLGPLSTAGECEQALRRVAKAVAAGRDPRGCLQAASGIVVRILWSTYQRKRLEIAGLNMRDSEDAEIRIIRSDFRGAYQEELVKSKQQAEEIVSLKARIASMEGKPRPRPPRPDLN